MRNWFLVEKTVFANSVVQLEGIIKNDIRCNVDTKRLKNMLKSGRSISSSINKSFPKKAKKRIREILCTSLDDMPLYVNDPVAEVRCVAKWRLFIGV